MHTMLLESIVKFLEGQNVTQYSIEGYHGFAYLTGMVFDGSTGITENVVHRFDLDLVNNVVIITYPI